MIMIFPMVIPSAQLPIVLLHTNIVPPAQLRVTGPGAGDCGGEGAGSHGPIDTPGWAGCECGIQCTMGLDGGFFEVCCVNT